MGPAIGDILPLAIGVAISPVPIIAVVLMLATPRGKANGLGFGLGWIAGLVAVSAIVLLPGGSDEGGAPADWTGWVKLVVGAIFVLLGLRQWHTRPRAGEKAAFPKWMQTIDRFTAVKSLGFGVILSGVNPKNLGLTLGAALAVAQAGLSTSEEIGAMVIFVVLASVTIVGPVAAYLALGERARSFLDGLKTWLGIHNAAIMTVLFLVLGLKLVGDGIGVLT